MLIRSDARHIPLADESVHCAVTSPPYWGLRAYKGNPGMIGLEATFEEHLENLVAVFREVRRVLRDDGTLWLNYGDAYAGSWGAQSRPENSSKARVDGLSRSQIEAHPRGTNTGSMSRTPVLKPKDLMMMPARVAMALQADGWWLRSEIIWHKPNPMPESCRDRPTSAHEKMFLLSKSARYFYDAEAVRVAAKESTKASDKYAYKNSMSSWATSPGYNGAQPNDHPRQSLTGDPRETSGANLRNVWKIATHSFKEAHFATFPPKLVEPCILAGTSAKGCCPECGAPWAREVEKKLVPTRKAAKTFVVDTRDIKADKADQGSNRQKDGHKPGYITSSVTTGWSPTCDHAHDPIPCTVLDPFAGSGTTVRVATRFNVRGIGCDLDYHDIAKKRTANVQRQLW